MVSCIVQIVISEGNIHRTPFKIVLLFRVERGCSELVGVIGEGILCILSCDCLRAGHIGSFFLLLLSNKPVFQCIPCGEPKNRIKST